MGKYVIESKFENTRCFLEVACENREPYFFINRVDSLTPYTEPDLEQVRKEAYQKGYETGYEDGYNEPGKNQQEAYQRGLNDARDAAMKIENLSEAEKFEAFGEYDMFHIMRRYTAAEAIEKLKSYEQEKHFHVGDEFENESGKRFVITKMDGTEIDRYIDEEGKTYCMIAKYKVMRKTGRHFSEIAAVLEKMREGQE